MPSSEAIAAVRLLSPRHWFLRPLFALRKQYYDETPSLVGAAANEWNHINGNRYRHRVDIARLTNDFFSEWLVSSNVIAIWRKRKDLSEPLPAILFPDSDLCEIVNDEGYLAVKFPRSIIGTQSAAGKGLNANAKCIISQNPKRQSQESKGFIADQYLADWDFELCQDSKTTSGLEYPSTGVLLDDLELLELFRIGDWAGAWKRREVIRHHKLGFGITSGPNATAKAGQASASRINATNQKMSQINGPGDLATNFDHEMNWLPFPKEHFLHNAYEEINRRLIYHGGYCAMMLMANKSQIESNGGHLIHQLRQETRSIRRSASERFLNIILNKPSYLGDEADTAPELGIQWGEQGLYSVDEMLNRVLKLGRPGYVSPQTLREWAGVSDEKESQRMQQAHLRREDYAPPYEFAQGMLPLLFPEEFADSSGPSTRPPDGDAGRPES